MTYVIAQPCTGVKDKACAGECPAGCICDDTDYVANYVAGR